MQFRQKMPNFWQYRQSFLAVFFISAVILGIIYPYYAVSKTTQLIYDQSSVIKPIPYEAREIKNLEEKFANYNFQLEAILAGYRTVPRLLPDRVPDGFAEIQDVAKRKTLFMQFLLPIILQANEEIQKNRTKVKRIRARADNALPISDEDIVWLAQLSQKYRTSSGDFAALLHRMDVLPVSLVMAQAAIESGWGSSRFAREGNALYGQWTTARYAGLAPLQRDQDKSHKIRVFSTPLAAVRSYIFNINTYPAYKKLRHIRAYLRNRRPNGAKGYELAMGLKAYSEKGMDYVALVLDVIRQNRLEAFHSATLDNNLSL